MGWSPVPDFTNPTEIAPLLEIAFSDKGVWDYLVDGATAAGLTLLQAAGFSVAEIAGVANNRYLLCTLAALVTRFDGTAQSAPIFILTEQLALERFWLLDRVTVEVEFWQDDTDGADVFGATESLFFGVSNDPGNVPGAAAGAATLFGRFGDDGAAASELESANMLAGALTVIGSTAGGTITEHSAWFQHKDLAVLMGRRTSVGTRIPASAGGNSARGRTPHGGNASNTNVGTQGYFGMYDIAGAGGGTVKIKAIRFWAGFQTSLEVG